MSSERGTRIHFTGGQKLEVSESVGEVQEAWSRAHGAPFEVHSDGQKVFVNPSAVAYWDPAPVYTATVFS